MADAVPSGVLNRSSDDEWKFFLWFAVLKRSDQKFILNGDYALSDSGVYEAAGAVFDYRRMDAFTKNSSDVVTEWITCTGPITEAVHLMVSARQ